jgi:hypothetical protein
MIAKEAGHQILDFNFDDDENGWEFYGDHDQDPHFG